jgi:hypothetical protein
MIQDMLHATRKGDEATAKRFQNAIDAVESAYPTEITRTRNVIMDGAPLPRAGKA